MIAKKLCDTARASPRLRKLGPKTDWFFEATIVSDKEIQALNKKYRKKNKPTDVLSFPSSKEFFKLGHLGELIMGEGVMKAQAKEHQHSVAKELNVLMTHGFLHLLGFDHERGPKAAREMAKWESKLLGTKTKSLITRSTET